MADQSNSAAPVLNNSHAHSDHIGTKFVDKTDKMQHRLSRPSSSRSGGSGSGGDQPAGGFDATPLPHGPPGYTLKFTFHRAVNLPFSDLNDLSSDPYVIATLKTDQLKRHKQDPDLVLRTPTIHKNVNPKWETEWIVAHVPASGFHLKCRLYDEDPADHDDRLGNVTVHFAHIGDGWAGIKEQSYSIKKRMGSKRAYFFRGAAAVMFKDVKMNAELVLSVENMGISPGQDGGRCYTIGPLAWTRHYSPLIGMLVGTKDDEVAKDGEKEKSKYNFSATQMQLQGPVPGELYHRYVEFKSFVAGMFNATGVRGRILSRALHHQHARIYNFDRSTRYGIFSHPGIDMTKQFLDFVQWDSPHIYTYVLTLDAQWRFTETGKEFGIDMLSKHTMHSDVSTYIAFSGEFFIRRLEHRHAAPDPDTNALPPGHESDAEDDQPTDPGSYELFIDNDSGTYRPNAELLPLLKKFMESNLPNLKVVTLDCKADKEKMDRLKNEQRERKKESGKQIAYQQNTSLSSLSSSDEEDMARRAGVGGGGEGGKQGKIQKPVEKIKGKAQMLKLAFRTGGKGVEDEADMEKDEGKGNIEAIKIKSGGDQE